MTAICIYGSQARGQTDEFSDCDVVFVVAHARDAEDERRCWQASGWNVSYFTHDHFERLVEFRSLFVQHLKLEGIIVRDDGEYLQHVLSSFRPAETYLEELKDALLPATWPIGEETSYWARLCLGDVLFVSIRNAAILHAATTGIYIYDYFQLVDHVVAAFGLTGAQRAGLLRLRAIKAAYRARTQTVDVGDTLFEAAEAMRFIRSAVLHLRDASGNGFVPNRYHALRQAELALVRNRDPRDLDRLDPSDESFALWQLVCNPADYPKLRAAPDEAPALWKWGNDRSR